MQTYQSATGLFTPLMKIGRKSYRQRFAARIVEVVEDLGRFGERSPGYKGKGKVRIGVSTYKVFGEPCDLPNCNCDARIELDEKAFQHAFLNAREADFLLAVIDNWEIDSLNEEMEGFLENRGLDFFAEAELQRLFTKLHDASRGRV